MANEVDNNNQTRQSNDSNIAVLTNFFRDSQRSLKTEQNHLTVFLVGAGILGTIVLLPIGALVLEAPYRWALIVPGAIVLSFAIMLRMKNKEIESCPSGLPVGLLPCSEVLACWATRSDAEIDIKTTILASRHELLIAGACLTTMKNTFADPEVIRHIVSMRAQRSNYHITILVVGNTENYPTAEEGRKGFSSNISSGRRVIKRFVDDIKRDLPNSVDGTGVDIRAYNEGVLPRHFILKADSVVYIGSYLCHEEGSYSYLFKLKETQANRSLHRLFLNEIEYLMSHSRPLDIELEITNEV